MEPCHVSNYVYVFLSSVFFLLVISLCCLFRMLLLLLLWHVLISDRTYTWFFGQLSQNCLSFMYFFIFHVNIFKPWSLFIKVYFTYSMYITMSLLSRTKCRMCPSPPESLHAIYTPYHLISRGNRYSEFCNYNLPYSFGLTSFNQHDVSEIYSCYCISNLFFWLSYIIPFYEYTT